MKSKNGTFVYNSPNILFLEEGRRIIIGWKDKLTGHFALNTSIPFIITPSELRELADFIEELQKQKD